MDDEKQVMNYPKNYTFVESTRTGNVCKVINDLMVDKLPHDKKLKAIELIHTEKEIDLKKILDEE